MILDPITWFDLYRRAENIKYSAISGRTNGNFGIAIATDKVAKRWQRADRQSRKFEGKLQVLLGQEYYKNICGRCGYMKETEACCSYKHSQHKSTEKQRKRL